MNLKNYYKFKDCNYNFTINDDILTRYNPIFYNNSIIELEKCIYNPHTIDYAVENPYYTNQINYYCMLENYPIIYNYITSKHFYQKIVIYKKKYPELNNYWNMWLNISPYADTILLNDYNIIDFNFLSLNPNCFEIYNQIINLDEYDDYIDILNDDLLSANPIIITYDYETIKENNKDINEELMIELYKPERIMKYLKSNRNLESYLN